MISRTYDLAVVKRATDPYRNEMLGFFPEDWLGIKENIALSDEEGNVCLFEYGAKGLYTGHYFLIVRGKQAVKAAKEMLKAAFSLDEIEVIRGLSPLEKLGARWMNRQLGFKSYGVIQTESGPCELVILTKNEWKGS